MHPGRVLEHLNQHGQTWITITDHALDQVRIRCLECGEEDIIQEMDDPSYINFRTKHLTCRVNRVTILDGRIILRWPARDDYIKVHHHYSNFPEVKLLLDQHPTWGHYEWEERDGYYRVMRPDGLAKFLYYKSPGEGFGGQVYNIRVKGRGMVQLKGPWSGNSAGVNACWPDDPVVEVSFCCRRWGTADRQIGWQWQSLYAGLSIRVSTLMEKFPWLELKETRPDWAIPEVSASQARIIGSQAKQGGAFYIPRLKLPDIW